MSCESAVKENSHYTEIVVILNESDYFPKIILISFASNVNLR